MGLDSAQLSIERVHAQTSYSPTNSSLDKTIRTVSEELEVLIGTAVGDSDRLDKHPGLQDQPNLLKTRQEYAEQIFKKLAACQENLRKEFFVGDRISSFYIDDLLNPDDARRIYEVFPTKEELIKVKNFRMYKYLEFQMSCFDPLLEEIIYSFQDARVMQVISDITGIPQLYPDETLSMSGISLTEQGGYLHPHLDNSHDIERKNYRALNLLYYVTPDWHANYGGNLELWDGGVGKACRIIPSQFNRLVVMMTNQSSWHSVSPVRHAGYRCCISNSYFSPQSVEQTNYFHVTSFRGRPSRPFEDILLSGDTILRSKIPESVKSPFRKLISPKKRPC
ncbi:MAG: 2OG-Fe(II) oxygenase [Kovacikia sp.]